MKKFNEFINEDSLEGKRIRLIQMNDADAVEPGTEGTIKHVDGIGQIHVEWDNGRTLAIVPEEDEYEIITEEMDGSAGGASTTSSPGSGTAVGGFGSGDGGMTFTSAMGVSQSGGDSGTAFATNSNVSGMGAIVSPQPSNTPGDVRGSKKGSGDIGSSGGTYTKQEAGKRSSKKKKKKSKKDSKNHQTANKIDNLYTTKYTQTEKGGKIIQNWKTFKENTNESLRDKMVGIGQDEFKKQLRQKCNDVMSYEISDEILDSIINDITFEENDTIRIDDIRMRIPRFFSNIEKYITRYIKKQDEK